MRKLIFAFCFLASASAWAGPRYASPTGFSDVTNNCENSNSPCTLQRAISQANTVSDPVILMPGFNGELAFTASSTVLIDKNLTIRAAAPLPNEETYYLNATAAGFPVVTVQNPAAFAPPPVPLILVSISDLSLSSGNCGTTCDGGALSVGAFSNVIFRRAGIIGSQGQNGGCVFSEGNLSLEDAGVRGCIGRGRGGAIYSTGNLLLNRTRVTGSRSLGNDAGGIYASGTVRIESSLIHSNYVTGALNAQAGHGLVLEGPGTKEIIRSTVFNNFQNGASQNGFNYGYELALTNAELSLNQAVLGYSRVVLPPSGQQPHPACGFTNGGRLSSAHYTYVSDVSCGFDALDASVKTGSVQEIPLGLAADSSARPQADSPVLNTANTNCPPDIFNLPRSYGCDAGAVELQIAAGCGNRQPDAGEQCDDGNTADGDGCSAACQNEGNPAPVCGNGFQELGEECDDSNTVSDDGCSSTCAIDVDRGGSGPAPGGAGSGGGCSLNPSAPAFSLGWIALAAAFLIAARGKKIYE